jgi:hypothetical protein
MFLRSMQIVTHLSMLGTIVPASVNKFLAILIPIITFDYLDFEWTTGLMFEFSEESQIIGQEQLLD